MWAPWPRIKKLRSLLVQESRTLIMAHVGILAAISFYTPFSTSATDIKTLAFHSGTKFSARLSEDAAWRVKDLAQRIRNLFMWVSEVA